MSILILPELFDTPEPSQNELNNPETYVLASLGVRYTSLTYQVDKRLWERVKKAINVYVKTPHRSRHTFTTRAHRAGVDDKTLQTMGGWKDLATMKNIYVHTQDEDLEIARKILTSSGS